MNTREFLDVYRGYRIPHFKLIEHRNWWFGFSAVLIVLSLFGIFVRGFNFSIDFEGGARISYPLRTAVTVQDVEATMSRFGYTDAEVQIVGGDTVQIRSASLSNAAAASATPSATASPGTSASPGATEGSTSTDATTGLLTALAQQAGVAYTDISVESIGPTWGKEISQKALRGLVVVLVAITLYIAFRFEWTMAAGAMVALVHDVTITAGVYALTGKEVTPETVIAILTILGFSLYDTVVIYDKIKENTGSPALLARMGYTKVVDLSLNQTVMRSVNTSLVVLLPILSLLLFGGETLKNFAFAMFIGVAIGAYSSIFIAAPILTVLKERQGAGAAPQRTRGGVQRPKAAVPVGAGEMAATSDQAAKRATAKQGARSRPGQKRRPPAKRKRR
ncbi:MAG TPA: protein translocase subunit SecF [Actinomycetota bacterium]|nr:protein translocase subunit SecF [Actinomycetota bacterium]